MPLAPYTSRSLADIVNRVLPPPPARPYGPRGAFAVQKGRLSVADAARNALRGALVGMSMDPTTVETGPLMSVGHAASAAMPAIFGAKARAKQLGLRSVYVDAPERSPMRSVFVHDPNLQERFGKEAGKYGGIVDALGQQGGDVAARVHFEPRRRLSPQGSDMLLLETRLGLKENIPSYKVEYAKALEIPDPATGRKVSADAAYGHEAMNRMLEEIGKELPKDQIYAVEAMLINDELMELAESMGLFGARHGYDTSAVFFGKNGRMIPLTKVLEELGTSVGRTTGKPVKDVIAEYRTWKRSQRARQREQLGEFRKVRRGGLFEDELTPSQEAFEGIGIEGAHQEFIPEEPIGFMDVPPEDIDQSYFDSLIREAERHFGRRR